MLRVVAGIARQVGGVCVFADPGAVPSVKGEDGLAKYRGGYNGSILLLDSRACGENTP